MERNLALLRVSKIKGELIGNIDKSKIWHNFNAVADYIKNNFKKDPNYFGLAYGEDSFYPMNNSELFVGNDGKASIFIFELFEEENDVWVVPINNIEYDFKNEKVKVLY